MLVWLKKVLEGGIERIKWFAEMFAVRLRAEMAIMKLLMKSEGIKKKRDSLARKVGERAVELKGQAGSGFFSDPSVKEAVKEMEALDKELEELKAKASEIGKPEL